MLRYSDRELDDDNNVIQMQNDHPLFKLSMELTNTELEKIALESLKVTYPTREKLLLEVFEVSIALEMEQEEKYSKNYYT